MYINNTNVFASSTPPFALRLSLHSIFSGNRYPAAITSIASASSWLIHIGNAFCCNSGRFYHKQYTHDTLASPGFEIIAMALYRFGNYSAANFRVSLAGIVQWDKKIRKGSVLLLVLLFTRAMFPVMLATVRRELLENETVIPSSSMQ
ncbi:MAG: hypothetical protein JWQ40_1920 [Segetibacter sp.]|nr:hypothetical protein [Segetibacter sp.]